MKRENEIGVISCTRPAQRRDQQQWDLAVYDQQQWLVFEIFEGE